MSPCEGSSSDLSHCTCRAPWGGGRLAHDLFFVAGPELKREFAIGDLKDPAKAALPVAAAMCGVAVLAVLYVAVASGVGGGARTGGDLPSGWANSTATDIAFALAVSGRPGHAPAVSSALLPAHRWQW